MVAQRLGRGWYDAMERGVCYRIRENEGEGGRGGGIDVGKGERKEHEGG